MTGAGRTMRKATLRHPRRRISWYPPLSMNTILACRGVVGKRPGAAPTSADELGGLLSLGAVQVGNPGYYLDEGLPALIDEAGPSRLLDV